MDCTRWIARILLPSKGLPLLAWALTLGLVPSCDDSQGSQVASGGTRAEGGALNTGGNVSKGGNMTSGGTVSTGGVLVAGGTQAGGMTVPVGGRGGNPTTGGTVSTGGIRQGGAQDAGQVDTGQVDSRQDTRPTGGTPAQGGATVMGGTVTTGGVSGGSTCTLPAPGSKGTNPLTTKIFTADPAPFVHDCAFYITAGHDTGNQQAKFQMNDWAILKSTNLIDWTLHEKALTIANFKWANANAWASQMVTKNGKFYWYVPVNKRGSCPNNCGMAIGVAVSDSPLGPFTDPLGKPLIDDLIEMANWNYTLDSNTPFTIDPTVYVDSDGSAYMHYGSFGRTVHLKLGSDMISIDGKLTNVDLGRLGGVSDGKTSFFEAPFLMKRNGKWYEIYAAGSNPAAINYSMADNPAGPWKAVGRILDPLPNVSGQDAATNHAGVAEFAGQWYIVYHLSNGPNGGGTYQREVAIDKLNFNADGTIQKVTPTSGITF